MEDPRMGILVTGGTCDFSISMIQKLFDIHHRTQMEYLFRAFLSSLGTQLKQQQDEVINKINTLWKVVSEKLDNAHTRDIAKSYMVHANVVSHDHQDSGVLKKKGIIKSPSKLFSPKYQARSSLGEKNRNSSSPKRVHFVYTISMVRKEDEPKETEILESCTIHSDDHNLVVEAKKIVEREPGVSKIMKEEGESSDIGNDDKNSDLENEAFKHETELGGEEEWMEYEQPLDLIDVRDELVYESLIEKLPSCSLNFDFRIEKGDPGNLKIPCMIGRKFIANAYIDLDLPMNVMSLAYYNTIRIQGYEHRRLKFVKIGMDMYVFVGNMSYVMDFTILENVEANIDLSLSQEVTFKTPYKDLEIDDLTSEGHDLLSSRVILSDDDVRRGCESALGLESGFYKGIDKLGPSYRKGIERIDLEVPFEAEGSRTSEGVT
ncbi:hypothetical protein Tco_1041173 [Tanacetum coccineum]|uniref:Uncharacterized protein n=1 Tax=Tanacetum coccineum TaxID=301880 RepID=A0ABQ5GGG6_9ASTR